RHSGTSSRDSLCNADTNPGKGVPPVTFRAVLWDVGGPINTELTHERLIDEDIRSALSDAGLEVSESNYAAANDWAVQTCAPNAYKAIIWHLSDRDADLARDIYRQVEERSHLRNQFELREG